MTKIYRQLASGLLFLLFALPIRYSYERLRLFANNTDRVTETAAIKNWEKLKKVDNKTVVFNCQNRYIETMFYTSAAAAYPQTQSESQIKDLILRGYKIAVVGEKDALIFLE